jgi:hypothetical protein
VDLSQRILMAIQVIVVEAECQVALNGAAEGEDVGMWQDRREIKKLRLQGKERRRIRGRELIIIEETRERGRWQGEGFLDEVQEKMQLNYL